MAAQRAQPVIAFVSVGSNIDPPGNIACALTQLARRVDLLGMSTFYRTAPIGPAGRGDFVNGVCRVRTEIGPRALKYDVLRDIEARLGRVRTADRYAPRPIDLDLLLYGEARIDQPGLTIPDPDISRPFITACLLELAPNLRLPGEPEALSCTHTVDEAEAMTPLLDLTRDLIESVMR